MLYPITQPIRNMTAKFNSPFSETVKEVMRWALSYLLAALVIGLIDQIDQVPETYCTGDTMSTCFPLREYALIVLTLLAKVLDVYKHQVGKLTDKSATPKGIFPV